MAKIQKLNVDTAKTGYEIKGTELDNIQKLQQAMMPAPMRVQ